MRSWKPEKPSFSRPKVIKEKQKESILDFFGNSHGVRWVILALVMAVFTIILYPNLLMTRPVYQVGDIADADIKAPRDFFVEDKAATEAIRRRATEQVLTVYDHNEALAGQIKEQVSATFEALAKTTRMRRRPPAPASLPATPPSPAAAEKERELRQARKQFFEEQLGIEIDRDSFRLLEANGFPGEVADVVAQVVSRILDTGVVANKEVLLADSDRGIMLRGLGSGTDREVRNLKRFYGPEQYKEMVRIIAQPLIEEVPPSLVPVVVHLSSRLVQPNVTLNRSETEQRKTEAAAAVEPIPYKIKAGEMLLREGERVTEEKLEKLRILNAQKNVENLFERSLGAVVMILCLLMITYYLHIHRPNRPLDRSNKDLLFLSTILIAFFIIPKISLVLFEALHQNRVFTIAPESMAFGIPVAAGAMTVCLFRGLRIALPFALVLSICVAVLFQNRFEMFIYFLLSSTMGAYWMQDCKERKVFIQAGAKLGVINVVLATAVDAYMVDFAGMKLFWDWAFAFIGGVTTGILTAGIVPLLEMGFAYTTDITLLELANLERPILRRLMLEAPGTYHHSVVVGSMVEAAASEIGANPALAKVCGYYHDIGKIKKPLYFIENQTDGKNRHDRLAPSMSSLILISHVKDGVETAKKHRLGQEIMDTIRQHHGTSLIKFFYEKAKKLKGEDAVNIENFRYPGPKPQTREAGLVMLADVVEAASRTLENPTPSRIQGNVQRLINGIFSDGQLDNCELTLKDLHKIAKSFNKILNGIHHHRIEYSEGAAAAKEKNGRPDQQPAKPVRDSGGKPAEQSTGGLKRLGVS